MDKFNNKESTNLTDQIAKEIIEIMEKTNPNPLEAFSVISSILLTLCESANVTELQFKNMMQELVNMYCKGVGGEK